jgi:hypothetical protein
LITGFGASLDVASVPASVDAVVSKPFLYSTLAKVIKEISGAPR